MTCFSEVGRPITIVVCGLCLEEQFMALPPPMEAMSVRHGLVVVVVIVATAPQVLKLPVVLDVK